MIYPKKVIALVFCLCCSPMVFCQNSSGSLKISHLTGDFNVYTSYRILNNYQVPSNSMYVVTNVGVVMFDTPWDTTQFQPLLDSIQSKHHKNVVLCIATHFHDDRTAGLEFLNKKGIKTYSSKLTYDLCKANNEKHATLYFTKDTVFIVGNHSFQSYFPGEGHTKDNIVIWFENEKILYGGCLVKSTESSNLGNLSDANVDAWPMSIEKIIEKFPNPKFVIPGHSGWKSNKGLQHTLELLRQKN